MKSIDWITSGQYRYYYYQSHIHSNNERKKLSAAPFLFDNNWDKQDAKVNLYHWLLYKRTQWQSICFSIFYSKSFWKDLDTDFTSNFQASFASPNQKGGCFVLNFVETTISNVFFQNITDRSKMQNAESRKQNAECRILEKSQF